MTSQIGTVYLKTANLQRLINFYTDVIGLQVHHQDGATTYLGAGGEDLLGLINTPDGKHYQGVTGLFHFALLVPSRQDLALSIKRLSDTRTRIQGMSDHIVSEAIYLADPDGNGIEIYHDRPQVDWYKDGKFQLDTLPLDLDGVISEIDLETAQWHGIANHTTMGHIHLHIGDIPQGNQFYTQSMGMDLMMGIPSALFLSYDRYHHHIGANIWGGRNQPPADALGLDHFEFRLNTDHLQRVLGELDKANIPIDVHGADYVIHDPSHNQIVLQALD